MGCKCIQFKFNSTGPSAKIIGNRFGYYSLSEDINVINDHSVYDLSDGGARIMYHNKFGWKAYGPVGEKLLPVDPKGNSDEIRFKCKAACIEECFSKNQTEPKLYFDSDQGESWLPDNHFSFKCTLEKQNSTALVLSLLVLFGIIVSFAIYWVYRRRRKSDGKKRTYNESPSNNTENTLNNGRRHIENDKKNDISASLPRESEDEDKIGKNANSTGIIENSSRSNGDKSNSDIEIYYEPMNKENRDVCSNCGGGCPMYMATCVEKLHK